MKTKVLLILIGTIWPLVGYNQNYSQYFDGADTSATNSINININNTASNIWQIGPPQKIIFDSAATFPNVIVTDTINNYPADNISRFQFTIVPWINWGILALRWMQKLDMDIHNDGGIVEFSVDSGITWSNAFNNPYVYNYYGFDTSNADTLQTGEFALSGTDSSWKDIWLCYDMTWLSFGVNITVRFTFISDSIDTDKEGWMIDNMLAHITMVHTVNEMEQKEYLMIYPNPTSGLVNIQARKINGFHIIEKMELIDAAGKIVEEYGISPTKFYIDISHHPDGIYFLKIKTNLKTESFKLLLQHK